MPGDMRCTVLLVAIAVVCAANIYNLYMEEIVHGLVGARVSQREQPTHTHSHTQKAPAKQQANEQPRANDVKRNGIGFLAFVGFFFFIIFLLLLLFKPSHTHYSLAAGLKNVHFGRCWIFYFLFLFFFVFLFFRYVVVVVFIFCLILTTRLENFQTDKKKNITKFKTSVCFECVSVCVRARVCTHYTYIMCRSTSSM